MAPSLRTHQRYGKNIEIPHGGPQGHILGSLPFPAPSASASQVLIHVLLICSTDYCNCIRTGIPTSTFK